MHPLGSVLFGEALLTTYAAVAGAREAAATHSIPSAFDTQPWHVIVLQDRIAAFWDRMKEAITAYLDGERRARYRTRGRDAPGWDDEESER